MARSTQLAQLPTASLASPAVGSTPEPLRRLRPALAAPRLSVIIVNYRQWEQTARLVRQLQASAAFRSGAAEVVVVDNHSPFHPVARKLRRMSGVSLRRWSRNFGFAKAVNEGGRLSRGDWFLLLNPDIDLSEGFLDGALALADQLVATEPKAGVVGFHLRNSEGSQQLSTGPFPSLWSTLTGLFLKRVRRKYNRPRSPERAPVAWVTGCCLLLRKACLEDLGGLDEDFFLYYEDVDLCLRARERGWTVSYEPNLAVVHHHPLHRRAVPAALRLVTRHSLLTYAAKHWPRWQFRVLAGVVGVETWLRRLSSWWRGDTKETKLFAALADLKRELVRGDAAAARARLDAAVRSIDVRVGV
ncbi:MAG: glycosyltransferase family 2 protein [Gemmataceae bacterium]